MEKLLLIIQSSLEYLVDLGDEDREKVENEFRTGLINVLNMRNIDSIDLYIEIFISLLNRILKRNSNDFNFIREMYDETSVISDYSFLCTFIDNVCNNSTKINIGLNSIIEAIEGLPKINKSNSWNVAIRAFCASIYTRVQIHIQNSMVDGINQISLEPLIKILGACEEIIISPIPDGLTDKEKLLLIEILLSHAELFCLFNDPVYDIIIGMLDSLGVGKNDSRVKNLKRFKKKQKKYI